MKDYLNNGERDPKRAITREDWVVYGIIAPIIFVAILGVGHLISELLEKMI